MRTTLRDFVDGKADLAFGSYGVPKPVNPGRVFENWSDPKDTEVENTQQKKVAAEVSASEDSSEEK